MFSLFTERASARFFTQAQPVFTPEEPTHIIRHSCFIIDTRCFSHYNPRAVNEHNLMDESMEFAIAIILSLDEVEGRGVLKNQLLRSATSIGANIREAQYASSRADFVLKLKIALKESNESEYWLELMERTHILASEKAETLLKACRHIRYMLVRSVNTAKANGRSN